MGWCGRRGIREMIASTGTRIVVALLTEPLVLRKLRCVNPNGADRLRDAE
jgi:hypothetical protein